MIHTHINGEEGVFLEGKWIPRFDETGKETFGIVCEDTPKGSPSVPVFLLPWADISEVVPDA